ncbi:hypothetical protein NQ318_016001 [Aromia moschata]|uniref:Uncharacterized protein n=1 Tax=Aromia moschata TaxID=1265417 RepID=A0AAV8Y3P6_9CUCU|nr:hypothetical protein NQ318_016001 [Aromia moschata]
MNSIRNLLKTPFSSLSLEEKVQIKTLDGFIREISAIRNSTETATSTEDEPNKIQPIKRRGVDTSTEDKNRELKEVCFLRLGK